MADDHRDSPPPARPLPPSDLEAYPSGPPPSAAAPDAAAHVVPATSVGSGAPCPRCGAENAPGLSFCRDCGQRLVTPGAAGVPRPSAAAPSVACPRCGTHNSATAVFCQDCGASLRPAAATAPGPAPASTPSRAILGPIVLLIGAIGLLGAWLLPFPFGDGSLWERTLGSAAGHGIAFWEGYADVEGGIAALAYYGFAAPSPLLAVLLVVLAGWGVWRAAPERAQRVLLAIALAWSLGLIIGFVVVELAGGPGGNLIDILRALSPGGILFLLAGLVAGIGAGTRLAGG